ncbi:hypothetical protein KFU94_14775 [Chloroflexi bacterium TSY]|nr:hypothetical protein [Chloroflexi bacterium TSY]
MYPEKVLVWLTLLILPIIGILSLLLVYQQLLRAHYEPSQISDINRFPLTASNLSVSTLISDDFSIRQAIFFAGPLIPGDPIAIDLDVLYTGTNVASGIVVTNIIPSEIINRSVISGFADIRKDETGPTYVWHLDNLRPNKPARISISGVIDPSLRHDLLLTNTASLATGLDTNLSNNVSKALISIEVAEANFDGRSTDVSESSGEIKVDVVVPSRNQYGHLYNIPRVEYALQEHTGINAASVHDHGAMSGVIAFEGYDRRSISIPIHDDDIDEDNEAFTLILTDSQGATLGTGNIYTVTIEDDDQAGVSLSKEELNLDEGNRNSAQDYEIVLDSQPTAPVLVDISSNGETLLSREQISFTEATWRIAQTITVTALDDQIEEGKHPDIIQHRVSSSDTKYASVPVYQLPITILDNDMAAFNLSPTQVEVSEDGVKSSYQISVSTEPTSLLVIELLPDADLSVTPSILEIDSTNWTTPQSIVVSAIDDNIDERNIDEKNPNGGKENPNDSNDDKIYERRIQHRLLEGDSSFKQLTIPPLIVAVTDNDQAGVIVSTKSISLAENPLDLENRSAYRIALLTEPIEPVSITAKANSHVQIEPLVLQFDSLNWSLPQTITAIALDNFAATGPQRVQIEHEISSQDIVYQTLNPISLTATITDDDVAGVLVSLTDTITVAEGGAPIVYEIVLTSQPTGTVTIKPGADSQIDVQPSDLTFDQTNWQTAQRVTVQAIDDELSEGDQSSTIKHSVISEDVFYSGQSVDEVRIMIVDNDEPSNFTVQGIVFEDRNGNGLREEGEPAVVGAIAILSDAETDGTRYHEQSETDTDGLYRFYEVPSSTYKLTIEPPIGDRFEETSEISVQVQTASVTVDNYPIVRINDKIYLPFIQR